MTAKREKAEQRVQALAARRGLSVLERGTYSAAICARAAELPELAEEGIILSYLAQWDEVDLEALHRRLLAAGRRLAYPLCGPDGSMEAWEPLGPLRLNRWGIREPDPACACRIEAEEIALVLVPCVGFDRDRRRLGRGAGYYDRYLARCPNAPKIAVAFEAQRLERVAAEPHDLPMDLVVTERAVCRKPQPLI